MLNFFIYLNKMKDLISVCITTKNEEDYIGFCLKSILNQTYDGNKEIIVLDSNSRDKTVEIARKYADKVVVKDSTIPQGRNLAVKQSEGNILCFLDADIVLSEDWFDTLLPYIYSSQIVAICGDLDPLEKNLKSEVFHCYQHIAYKVLQAIKKPIYSQMATAVLIERNVFEKVDGFREDLTFAEDFDLSLRLSRYGKLKYVKKAKGFVSMRRLERYGYLKMLYIWGSSLPLIFGKIPPLPLYTREFP